MGAGLLGAATYFVFFRNSSVVEAKDQPKKSGLVRRHSSGDHAFLPNRLEREAKKIANSNFGVQKDNVQDREGDRLPTTRGY